jgi:hypothetical protein
MIKITKLIKILCCLAFVIIVVSFAVYGSNANCNETIEKPRVILGLSKIELNPKKTVGAQVDRVIRDLFINNSTFDVRGPADRIPKNSSDVIPWMEGSRIREMMDWAGVKVLP